MKLLCAVFVVALSACFGEIDPILDSKCQEWVLNNQKDMIILNQVAAASHIGTCGQYCMVAGSGIRSDTTTCRTLCEAAGGYAKFSKALDSEDSTPDDMCRGLLQARDQEDKEDTVVSLLEVGSKQSAVERKLGVRGDMTVQGTLSTSMLTSPIGDVKVSGELNVLNQIESNTARGAFLKSETGVSIKNGIVSKKDQLLIKGKIDADAVTADGLSASFLEIGGVRQWALHSLEDFEEVGTDGWSHGEMTECAGRKVLGGHCVERNSKDKELSKQFNNLPPHTQVRVVASYMFIDSWDGETGYMKVQDNTVWAETYDHALGDAKHGINMCGNGTPERKFKRAIDITVPHTGTSVQVSFGATTDEHSCDESFAIDSVMVFTR